jgi:mRNA interferase RelE/StbE
MDEVPYRIVPTRVFLKDLRKLERNYEVHRRVVAAIEQIAQNPYAGVRVRHKETGCWRWRVGDYRIRYDIVGKDVVLHRVRHRREIYRLK